MTMVSTDKPLPVIASPHLRNWLEESQVKRVPIWRTFGADFRNGIDGWIFTDDEIRAAARDGRLLHLDYEFGTGCSLRCCYCFRAEDARDGSDRPMSFEKWENVVEEAAGLGLKSVKLLGQGELMEHKQFFRVIEAFSQRGITPLLFTAAHVIGDDELCRKIHGMDGVSACRRLYELGASVMVKVNSFVPEIQDRIVGRQGYTEKRNRGLERLIAAGFTDHNPTRLGLEVAMMRPGKEELVDIYNLKFMLNVYIDLDPFMPCGLTREAENLEFELTFDEKMEFYRAVYENNIRFGAPFRGVSPYAGGQVCSQLGYGLYVNVYGKVFPCPGAHQELGDVANSSLKSIFETAESRKQYLGRLDHGCPFREDSGILQPGWEDGIRSHIEAQNPDRALFRPTVSAPNA